MTHGSRHRGPARLIMLAAALLGAGQIPCALAATQFADVTATPGSELDSPVDVQGVAWGDADNDGDLDVYVTLLLSAVIGSGKRLYINDGGDIFRNEASLRGVNDDQTGFGACFGDFDNDTDQDLALANGLAAIGPLANALRVYANDGRGYFTNIGAAPDLDRPQSGRSITWCDYDNDGDLDLFIATPSVDPVLQDGPYLLRNDRGTFTDVTSAVGIIDPVQAPRRLSYGAAWADYDQDGDQDLYLVNHGVAPLLVEANYLFRNGGPPDFHFTEVAASAGVADTGAGNGAAWGDCDNDGDLDLYVANGLDLTLFGGINAPKKLYRNDGAGSFTDITNASGTRNEAQVSFSAAWADFDLDGWLDLYVTNSSLNGSDAADKLFHNEGNCVFTDIAASAGVSDTGLGQGTAVGDYNNDGLPDLFVANLFSSTSTTHLYKNVSTSSPPNHWIVVHLIGTNSNRDGVGALVQVHSGGRVFTRQVAEGSGYISEDSLDAEFGLGTIPAIADVTIHWPSGCVQVVPAPPADQILTVIEDCVPGFDDVAVADDPCASGLAVTWEIATFASGAGHYEVRRGTDCPDASRQPELLPRPTGFSFFDATTSPGLPYVYVVRAIDDVNGVFGEQCAAAASDVDGSNFPVSASAPSPVCPGTTVDLSATGPPGAGYAWDFDISTDADGNTIPDDDIEASTADASTIHASGGSYTARVSVTSLEGCTRTAEVTVVVVPDPGPVIDAASLRVTRVGPADPLLAWTISSGTGDTDIRRNLDKTAWLPDPLAVPVVATVPGSTYLDSIALSPGQCAFYQVLGHPCGP